MNKKSLDLVIKILIVLIIVVGIILGISFIQDKIKFDTYNIKIRGENTISIYEGDKYYELGYDVYDYNNNLIDIKCNEDSNLNTDVPGNYRIIYSINSLFKKNTITRYINVLENPLKGITFELKGDSNINVDLKNDYQDLGFTCLENNASCDSEVVVTNNLNINKLGDYTIKYSLTKGSKNKELVRNIKVVGEEYTATYNKEITNQDVEINYLSNINEKEFSNIILPDNSTVSLDNAKYNATQNGTYIFKIIKKDNKEIVSTIIIDNIDKEKPTGTCNGVVTNNKTTLTLTSNDNYGIDKYLFDNSEYKENIVNLNKAYDTGKLSIYDKAGNYTDVDCDIYYSEHYTSKGSVASYDSDTLKYDITSQSNYKIAYIWVRDPYNQLKTELGGNPTGLKIAKNIMTTAISNKGFANKGMVAVNGSAFTSSRFDSYFKSANSGWRDTAVTEILMYDSKLLRNYTTGNIPKAFVVYGLDRNNKLTYYNFTKGTNLASNKKVVDTIINDGVKYSFGFCPVLVVDGKSVYNNSINNPNGCKLDLKEDNNRTAICQINKNNYALFSGYSNFNNLSKLMIQIGCTSGYNLDGGGSCSMLYKTNSNSINSVKSAGREVADIVYFVEK